MTQTQVKESAYIKVANLLRLRTAMSQLLDVMHGPDYGVNKAQIQHALQTVMNLAEQVSKSIEVVHD